MKKLIDFYESAFLYLIGIIYFIVIFFRINVNESIELRYIFFEAAILLSILVITREFIMFNRIRKLDVKTIFEYSKMKYFVRIVIFFIFYLLFWFSNNDISNILIIMAGLVLTKVLPRPISERFYVMDSGYFLNGTYYEYSYLEKLNLSDSGTLDIKNNGEKIRALYHSKKQLMIIYEYLKENIK